MQVRMPLITLPHQHCRSQTLPPSPYTVKGTRNLTPFMRSRARPLYHNLHTRQIPLRFMRACRLKAGHVYVYKLYRRNMEMRISNTVRNIFQGDRDLQLTGYVLQQLQEHLIQLSMSIAFSTSHKLEYLPSLFFDISRNIKLSM
jgi:hypothetical protein